MNISSCQSLPYPETDGIMRAPAFINDVAKVRLSELSDVSDYVYYSLMLEECYPELSALFDKMAMTEMRHFLLLGRMLIRLGGDPAVRVRQTNPFYGKPERLDAHAVHRMLAVSLEREQGAMNIYKRMACAMSCDTAAAALLDRIAADEEHHARMLSRAIDSLEGK